MLFQQIYMCTCTLYNGCDIKKKVFLFLSPYKNNKMENKQYFKFNNYTLSSRRKHD